MALQDDLNDLRKKVELREKQLNELHQKHSNLLNKVKAIDKRTEIRPVLLKEVSPSMMRTIISEAMKAGLILVVTYYLNKVLSAKKIEEHVEKEVQKRM